MKIAVKDLEPNPFRDFDNYPIDRERVNGLRDSIKLDTFWGGIPVRPHPTKNGKYQIGCGHHRLISLQENGVKEIDVPVEILSDARMLRIMINENVEYAARPKLINADVEKARNFLVIELTKYETWEQAYADNDFSIKFPDIKNAKSFARLKEQHIGRPTILTYLGKPWEKRAWMIQEALASLKDSETFLDRQALETIPTMFQARTFRQNVKAYKTPKKKQKILAKKIAKEGIGKRDIPKLVKDHAIVSEEPARKNKRLLKIKALVENIDAQSRALYNNIMNLRRYMKQMEIEELKGVKVWLAASSVKQLFKELERLKGKDSL